MKTIVKVFLAVIILTPLCGCQNLSAQVSHPFPKKPNTLRVLLWNIQNGMWSDQQEDYANFLEFVKRYDPDVCVWCEGQSIYKSGTKTKMPKAERYFPDHWQEFASGYGHGYVAISGYRLYAGDYFPQIITSKYPIETVLKITETDERYLGTEKSFKHSQIDENYRPVAHGAGMQRVRLNGMAINFVTLHLWPHAYSYYAKYVSKDTEDSLSVGGNAQRLAEISYICEHTINSKDYAEEQNWLMLGDFNTRSRIDNWYYKLPEDSPMLSSHDYILENTPYKDVIALKHPGEFFSTRTWVKDAGDTLPPRYDFIYASPAMFEKVRSATVLKDDKWLGSMPYSGLSNFYNPSDHWPVLVDFEL